MYVGLYENTSTGAKIYKRTFVVGVENISSENPTEYKLEQNYPNPFNPITTIQFSIPEREYVRLEIFNSLGEKVSTLVSEELNAGSYKFDWNAESFSSGIYYYALATSGFSKTRKLVLLK
ncbi:MAG: T9SS type A sorting domain-containing protein, partial [Ignavibacteriaceae bacterium]|nr:T9SS type A sorting domain-containing protein [Ignavibacteriaceae bacterium]